MKVGLVFDRGRDSIILLDISVHNRSYDYKYRAKTLYRRFFIPCKTVSFGVNKTKTLVKSKLRHGFQISSILDFLVFLVWKKIWRHLATWHC